MGLYSLQMFNSNLGMTCLSKTSSGLVIMIELVLP